MDMLEKVAEAIWSAHTGSSDFHEDTYRHNEKEREWWRFVAKEAIKAIDAHEDADFAKRYTDASGRCDYFTMAHVLSGRLRQMDKRAKAANTRADKAEAALAALSPSGEK